MTELSKSFGVYGGTKTSNPSGAMSLYCAFSYKLATPANNYTYPSIFNATRGYYNLALINLTFGNMEGVFYFVQPGKARTLKSYQIGVAQSDTSPMTSMDLLVLNDATLNGDGNVDFTVAQTISLGTIQANNLITPFQGTIDYTPPVGSITSFSIKMPTSPPAAELNWFLQITFEDEIT